MNISDCEEVEWRVAEAILGASLRGVRSEVEYRLDWKGRGELLTRFYVHVGDGALTECGHSPTSLEEAADPAIALLKERREIEALRQQVRAGQAAA
jgi:hypothetical protein